MKKVFFAFVLSVLIVGLAHAQNAGANPETSYRFKAVGYASSWDVATLRFKTIETVYFFNRWEVEKPNRWNKSCSNKGLNVRFYDGQTIDDDTIPHIIPHIGDSQYHFSSLRFSRGAYQCYDERRMTINDLNTGKLVWQSSNL